jgi:hypothetical protein
MCESGVTAVLLLLLVVMFRRYSGQVTRVPFGTTIIRASAAAALLRSARGPPLAFESTPCSNTREKDKCLIPGRECMIEVYARMPINPTIERIGGKLPEQAT